nr:MAG TPA: hypothetical protein [Caudoviricetes sp.]
MLAGIPSMMVISASLTFLCSKSILFSPFFCAHLRFIIQILPCAVGKQNTDIFCRMAQIFSAPFSVKNTLVSWG